MCFEANKYSVLQTPPIELLSEDRILSNLESISTQSISQLIILGKTESTNSYLLKLCAQSMQSGIICIAESQTMGRGRRGKNWVSPSGHNIYFSMSWQFERQVQDLSGLSLVIGLAVMRVLRSYPLNDLSLKWPNDVYCQNQKLAGILIDIVSGNDNQYLVVIGIGLNRWIDPASSDSIDQRWTDLFSLLGEDMPSRNEMIAKIIHHLTKAIAEFNDTGFAGFHSEWNQFDYLIGQQVALTFGNQLVDGIARGVNSEGLLVIENDQGHKQAYSIGEVLLAKQ